MLVEVLSKRSRRDSMEHYSLGKETRTAICYFTVWFLVFAISEP